MKIGDKVCGSSLKAVGADGDFFDTNLQDLSAGKKILVFALPGAFTPTCSVQHLPGYLTNYDEIIAKGVDQIACLCVLDQFVLRAWAKNTGALSKITMLADGNGDFTRNSDMMMDLSAAGLGHRSKRYAMIVENGHIVELQQEENVGNAETSGAEAMLKLL